MMTTHNLRFFLVACAIIVALSARADGEERNEKGTTWVDPVEFYHLQDISRTDFQRDYDQGDIDFNRVLKEKGVKVFGLRLKPFCAAGLVEKYMREVLSKQYNLETSYQDLYGVCGVPINEASFCVYFGEGVRRTYTIDYTVLYHKTNFSWNLTCKDVINIDALQLVNNDGGVGFSYAITERGTHNTYVVRAGAKDHADTHHFDCDKSAGTDSRFGRFIYFQGARDLIVMLSAPARQIDVINTDDSDRKAMMNNHPWARVFFIVEEILIADEGGGPVLSEETRQELRETMDGMIAWLSGEGDPLGLGEHTDAKTSAVINTLSTIASILLANGIVSIAGGSSSSIVGSLMGSAGAGGTPPPVPDANLDALNVRRRDEDEDDKTPPPTPDPNAKLFKQYVKTDADGDLTMKDPITGKETIYVRNGDGTYTNLTTGQSWTTQEIGERLRYETENRDLLKADADQAAKNVAEQQAQWDAQNKHDQERGYSDEMEKYQEWKEAEEAKLEKQLELERLARKYGVAPTEKAVKDAIQFEQVMNQIDSQTHLAEAEAYGNSIEYLTKVDKYSEVAVNVMAGAVPGGNTVKNAYTFAKSTLVATSEAIAEGKDIGEGTAHILVGMGSGALGVIQNEAGNLTEGKSYAMLKEWGVNVATEDLKEGMKAIAEGKSIDEIGKTLISTTGKKSAEFGLGKLVSGGMDKLKDKAAASLNPADTSRFKFGEGTAKNINKWLNKENTASFGIGKRADVFKVKVNDVGLKGNVGETFRGVGSVAPGEGFSIFHTGAVNTRSLTENLVNEGLSWSGASESVGNLGSGAMEWANDKAVGAAANVMYGADKTIEYFKNIADFSDAAAAFKKQ